MEQNWSATTLRCKMPNVRCNVKCLSEKWTNWNLSLVLSDNFWGKSSSTNFPVYVCFLHQWKYRIKIVDVCPALKVSVTSFMTRAISVKLSAEMWLMIILKVTKSFLFSVGYSRSKRVNKKAWKATNKPSYSYLHHQAQKQISIESKRWM